MTSPKWRPFCSGGDELLNKGSMLCQRKTSCLLVTRTDIHVIVHNLEARVKLHICSKLVPCWKHFPRYWSFERGIHRGPVNPPHKGQWRGALVFSLICAWINGWVNNRKAGDLRRHRAHYDVSVMHTVLSYFISWMECSVWIIH